MYVRKHFPTQGRSWLLIFRALKHVLLELKKFKRSVGPGNLITFPSLAARLSWHLLLHFNPGNLGNWSIKNQVVTTVTGKFERDVVLQLLDLYGADADQYEGYFTSGATEANIYSAWLGRKQLQTQLKIQKSKTLYLLRTDLSHYSIDKAADIVDVPTLTVPLRDDWGGMDSRSLVSILQTAYKNGGRGFLIPLTLGFTLTGTDDHVVEICKTITNFRKKHPDAHFFVWVDAALAGFVKPFLSTTFKPLHALVSTIAVDFHKFARVPLPAGVVLYKKGLRKLIEKPIRYLSESDSTLLGSRTGISPVAAWATIQEYGKDGYRKLVKKNVIEKRNFIEQYSQHSDLEMVYAEESLSLGIIINRRHHYWKQHFSSQYGIHFQRVALRFVSGVRKLTIGKVFFIQ